MEVLVLVCVVEISNLLEAGMVEDVVGDLTWVAEVLIVVLLDGHGKLRLELKEEVVALRDIVDVGLGGLLDTIENGGLIARGARESPCASSNSSRSSGESSFLMLITAA